MGLSRGSASMRVLQVRRGRPLTSAEQEPHLPALQFQRTAKSGAWCAWMWCRASSTTIPGAIGTRYVAGCPPSRSPRNTSKIASAIAPPLISVVAPASCRLSRRRLALGPAGETPAGQPPARRRYKSIFLPPLVASIHWAFPTPVIGAGSLRFPRGRLHCFSFPRLDRGRDDQSGCELLGSLRGQTR